MYIYVHTYIIFSSDGVTYATHTINLLLIVLLICIYTCLHLNNIRKTVHKRKVRKPQIDGICAFLVSHLLHQKALGILMVYCGEIR